MSQIAELISQLCPKGVDYAELEALFTLRKGENLTSEQAISGEFPVITASRGSTFFHNDFNFNGECITISSHGAYAGFVSYYNQKFWLGNNVYLFESKSENISTRFYFHVLKSFAKVLLGTVNTGGIPYINAKDLKRLRVPHPPIEVQNEIVRILDTFTELEAELEAELEKRKIQYEFYRNRMLSFPEGEAGVRWIPMGDLLRKLNSYTAIEKSEYRPEGQFPIINQAQQLIAGYSDREELALPIGQYIIFGDHTRSVKYFDRPFIPGESGTLVFTVQEFCRPKYLYFAFMNLEIQSRGYNRHWSVVKNMEIPVPSLETQDEIIAVLDRFSQLTGEFSGGLPAEIAARRQQYEYYRSKLLTFKKLEVA